MSNDHTPPWARRGHIGWDPRRLRTVWSPEDARQTVADMERHADQAISLTKAADQFQAAAERASRAIHPAGRPWGLDGNTGQKLGTYHHPEHFGENVQQPCPVIDLFTRRRVR